MPTPAGSNPAHPKTNTHCRLVRADSGSVTGYFPPNEEKGTGGCPSLMATHHKAETRTMSSKTEAVEVVAAPATEAPQNTAVAARPSTGMAFVADDIEIPRLNVVQKMSTIEGPIGSVTIDKEEVLLQAEQKTHVVVISAVKKWKEDVPYDDDVIPKIALTQADADRIAAESSYEVTEFAEIIILIPQFEGADESLFPYPIGDKNYQLGRITVQKDAYRLTYKRLFTFQTFNPNSSVAARQWFFGTELMSKGKYTWYVPTLSVSPEATPEAVMEFVNSLTGGAR